MIRQEQIDDSVRRARRRMLGPIAVVLGPAALSGWLASGTSGAFWVMPATLLGLVGPVLVYRVYLMLRDKAAESTGTDERCRGFERAGFLAASLAAGLALFGVLVFIASGKIQSMAAVLTGIIAVGAIWPTPEKLEIVLDVDSSVESAR